MSYSYRNADPLASALREGAEAASRPARRAMPLPSSEQVQLLQMANEMRNSRARAEAHRPTGHDDMMQNLKRIAGVANAAGVPLGVAIMAMVEDPAEREDYMRILGSVLTAINAPVLVNQGQQAIRHHNDPGNVRAPSGVEALAHALPMIAMLASS